MQFNFVKFKIRIKKLAANKVRNGYTASPGDSLWPSFALMFDVPYPV